MSILPRYQRYRYTKEILQEAVTNSESIAGVIRFLNLRYSSGRFATIKEKIRNFNIDSSHFLGRAANKGESHKGGPKKKSWKEVLVLRDPHRRRESAYRLRRALIEMGREYKCEVCNKPPLWNGKELRLRVDHINSEWWDCRPGNLQFICPDCHSQTETWGHNYGLTDVASISRYNRETRKRKREEKDREGTEKVVAIKYRCSICNINPAWRKDAKCKECFLKSREKISWPEHEVLVDWVAKTSLTFVSKELGVTNNAVKKRIKKYDPNWKSNYKPIPPIRKKKHNRV